MPGFDGEYIRRIIGEISLDCPDKLVEFYSYCGGVGAPEGALFNRTWIYGSHCVLPFCDAVKNYEILNKHTRWNKSWFPIIQNEAGDFYSVTFRLCDKNWEKITYFMLYSGDELQIQYSSIANMFTVFNECFDRGICSVDIKVILPQLSSKRVSSL